MHDYSVNSGRFLGPMRAALGTDPHDLRGFFGPNYPTYVTFDSLSQADVLSKEVIAATTVGFTNILLGWELI